MRHIPLFLHYGGCLFPGIAFVGAQMLHGFGAPNNYPLQGALQQFYIMPIGSVHD